MPILFRGSGRLVRGDQAPEESIEFDLNKDVNVTQQSVNKAPSIREIHEKFIESVLGREIITDEEAKRSSKTDRNIEGDVLSQEEGNNLYKVDLESPRYDSDRYTSVIDTEIDELAESQRDQIRDFLTAFRGFVDVLSDEDLEDILFTSFDNIESFQTKLRIRNIINETPLVTGGTVVFDDPEDAIEVEEGPTTGGAPLSTATGETEIITIEEPETPSVTGATVATTTGGAVTPTTTTEEEDNEPSFFGRLLGGLFGG